LRTAQPDTGIVYCSKIGHDAKGKQGVALYYGLPGTPGSFGGYGVLVIICLL